MTKHLLTDPQQMADRLGHLRVLIRSLKAEEATLRAALLDMRANEPVCGQAYQALVQERRSRRFDHKGLPEHILEDPRYWKSVSRRAVITRPLPREGPARAGPRAYAPQHEIMPEPEVQLIEPW